MESGGAEYRKYRSAMGMANCKSRPSMPFARLVLMALCLFSLLWWSSFVGVVNHGRRGLRRMDPPVDVVGFARKPTCVTQESVRRLNAFIEARRIFIVTTEEEFCRVFEAYANNVHCLTDKNLLPGVSHESISAYLRNKYGIDGTSEHRGRELSGWYMQQFLKLGAADYIESLSQYFLVWDLDMLLLRKLDLFYHSEHNLGGSLLNTPKTVVNIGGSWNLGYVYAYNQLTGEHLELAPDGTSFVAHWMVMYQPYLKEFLGSLISNRPVPRVVEIENTSSTINVQDSPQWVWQILNSLHPNYLSRGFSEYASYGSWVKQNYPDSQHILKEKTWDRHPFSSEGSLVISRHLNKDGLCCPHPLLLNPMQLMGYQFVGFEIGHVKMCNFTDREYRNGYGVS